MNSRKGEAFSMLIGLATSLGVLAIILVTTFMIISTGQSQIGSTEGIPCNASTTTSVSCNGTKVLNTSVAELPNWLPIIILCGVGAVMLTLVATFAKGRSY